MRLFNSTWCIGFRRVTRRVMTRWNRSFLLLSCTQHRLLLRISAATWCATPENKSQKQKWQGTTGNAEMNARQLLFLFLAKEWKHANRKCDPRDKECFFGWVFPFKIWSETSDWCLSVTTGMCCTPSAVSNSADAYLPPIKRLVMQQHLSGRKWIGSRLLSTRCRF